MANELDIDSRRGLQYSPGDNHYRAFVGPSEDYDRVAVWQFSLLTTLGMREENTVLDIGCGSLRAGRLFIPYLLPGNYYGLEPVKWVLEEGIKLEVGQDQIELKKPHFTYDENFTLSVFDTKFDYLIAQSIFSHAAEKQIRRCFEEAAKVMHADSVFAATFFAGDSNYEGEEWVYPGIITYRPEYMVKLAEEYGFKCHIIDWPHRLQTWMLLIKPENKLGFDVLERRLILPPFFNDRFVPVVDRHVAEIVTLRNDLAATRQKLDTSQKELAESRQKLQAQAEEMQKLQAWALEMQERLANSGQPQIQNVVNRVKGFLKK